MQKTLIIKLSIIAGLCMIFGIGLNMISALISERQHYSEAVIKEIAEQHVNPQQVITPFITVPALITPSCSAKPTDLNVKCAKPYTVIDTFFASQTTATQDLDVSTDTYQRGIYHATSYNGDLLFNQTFKIKPSPDSQQSELTVATPNVTPNTSASTAKAATADQTYRKTIQWDKARIIIPVSDLRGVNTLPTITINKQHIKATYPESNTLGNSSQLSYVEAPLPSSIANQLASASQSNQSSQSNIADSDKSKANSTVSFNALVTLPLSGISTLNTVPTGKNFELAMTSNWHAPNFIGKALPNAKTFSKEGFEANWQNQYLTIANNQYLNDCLSQSSRSCSFTDTMSLSTDDSQYDEYYAERSALEVSEDKGLGFNSSDLSSFGVSFAEPNDVYLQTERTMKYALLLILVSFGTFFLFEIIKASRIHPIQYLLVGSALLVFYVLLLPLAEQIAFWLAYAIADCACVGLIGWYSYYLLGSAKRAVLFTAILGGLYASFYGILTMEDLNLLLGAVFCFALLASVMIMTRKIDWYKVA